MLLSETIFGLFKRYSRVGTIIDKDQLWLEWTQWRRENLGKSQASERVLMSRVAARRDAFV